MELEIRNLYANIGEKEILKGVSLRVRKGEVHAIMGPNGSGKSTLSNVLMGHPRYTVTKGDILVNGESILELSPDERAKRGLFLAFQYPLEVQGVRLTNFLRTAYNATHEQQLSAVEFHKRLIAEMKELRMDESFAKRYLNEGFSGGEKKKCEILQMALLQPSIAILDETDSGLDIDALRIVSEGVRTLAARGMGALLITHYHRILEHVKPQFVHVFVDGRIAKSGGQELALELEKKGYASLEGVPQ